jgi:hypothetical protein
VTCPRTLAPSSPRGLTQVIHRLVHRVMDFPDQGVRPDQELEQGPIWESIRKISGFPQFRETNQPNVIYTKRTPPSVEKSIERTRSHSWTFETASRLSKMASGRRVPPTRRPPKLACSAYFGSWVRSSRRLRAVSENSRATALTVSSVPSVAGMSSASGERRRTAASRSSFVFAS